MTLPTGLGEYEDDELLQELAARSVIQISENDETGQQNYIIYIKNITIDKPNN